MTAALVTVLLPWSATGHAQTQPVTSRDLPALTAELERVTARVEQLSAALDVAAARDGGLKVAYDRTLQAKADAQQTLGVQAREVYMATSPAPFSGWLDRLADPDLARVAHQGAAAALAVDQSLVDAVTTRSHELARLQAQAEAFRHRLQPQVDAVLAEQDHARDLLAQAEALAAQERQAAFLARLEAQHATLDSASTQVAYALTPGQAARAQQALAREDPVVRLLEATGSGYPYGYQPTGETETGDASWYGPGFVGSPTASGAPYDPERLTCAHKTLPLGTVIRVSTNGLAVNCLVDDRGPYVAGRIVDMSRAGARALGYSGVAHVVVEVLAPVG